MTLVISTAPGTFLFSGEKKEDLIELTEFISNRMFDSVLFKIHSVSLTSRFNPTVFVTFAIL